MKDKQLLLPLEVNIRGGVSSINADRYVESDVIKQILYVDANKLYGMQSVKIFLPVNSKHYRFRENTNKNILNRKTWKVYYNVQMTTRMDFLWNVI